ncbi:hypothetical protein O7A70_18250, partial [Mesorhizobium sp. Cs1299R1N1]|uniref:hypothetical protein n=1 Tax=Mesorhizobium sp. Cs1299R1N1 TaxID=3015172 RepID=UPI00301C1AE5
MQADDPSSLDSLGKFRQGIRQAESAGVVFENRSGADIQSVLGWTAPDGIAMCQNEVVADLNKGDRPWINLFALAWIRQRAF